MNTGGKSSQKSNSRLALLWSSLLNLNQQFIEQPPTQGCKTFVHWCRYVGLCACSPESSDHIVKNGERKWVRLADVCFSSCRTVYWRFWVTILVCAVIQQSHFKCNFKHEWNMHWFRFGHLVVLGHFLVSATRCCSWAVLADKHLLVESLVLSCSLVSRQSTSPANFTRTEDQNR